MPMTILPNISTVERVRALFVEIVGRRLDDYSIITNGAVVQEYQDITEFLFTTHYNVYPHLFVTETSLTAEWSLLNDNKPVLNFIYSVMIELRQRAFENQEDYNEFLSLVAESMAQFSDTKSVMSNDDQQKLPTAETTRGLIGGNSWAIFYLLLEQTDIIKVWSKHVGPKEQENPDNA